jgi:hypothetical protein
MASLTFLGAAQTVTGSRHLLTTSAGKPGRTFLVHGEPPALEAQRARLAARGWRVEAPQPGAEVELA